jgi:hypothetical protein
MQAMTFVSIFRQNRSIFSLGLAWLMLFMGCAHPSSEKPAAVSTEAACMAEIVEKTRRAPAKKWITTLDGQQVEVREFIDLCHRYQPDCILYEKFYHWQRETKTVVSEGADGAVSHLIRVYLNPLSVCFPAKVDSGRTHGDVVEFYDEKGAFMGLAVYMGLGRYFPIPYSGYASKPE